MDVIEEGFESRCNENFKNIKLALLELTDAIAEVSAWKEVLSMDRKNYEEKRMKLLLEFQEKYKFTDEDLAAFIRLSAWEPTWEDKKQELHSVVVPENPIQTS